MNFAFSSLLLSAAALGAANVLTAEAGAFSVAGQDVTLPTYRITCETGKFRATGRAFNQPLAPADDLKLVTLGDSIMEFANGTNSGPATATRLDNQADGEIYWVKARGKAGFRHESYYWQSARWIPALPAPNWASAPLSNGANQGRASDWASGVKRRLTAVFNMNPDIVVLNIGTNNGPVEDNNISAATTISEIGQIVAQLAGVQKRDGSGIIRLVIGTLRPRAISASGNSGVFSIENSPSDLARQQSINDYIRTLDNNSTCFVWDPWNDLADPNPTAPLIAGSPYRWVVRDGVHLTPRGAAVSSLSLEQTIDRVLSDGTWFDPDPTVDNAITNGALTGTGGTVGGGVSGQAPDNFNILNTSGANAITTTTSAISGGAWQIAVSSVGGGSSSSNIHQIRAYTAATFTPASKSWTSSTWVKAFAKVTVSNQQLLGGLHLDMVDGSGQTSNVLRSASLGWTIGNRASQDFEKGSWSGWLETTAQQVGSTANFAVRVDIEPYIDRPGDAVVTIESIIMREVEDPRTLFPYDPMDPQVYGLAGQDVALNRSGSALIPNLVAETGVFTAAAQDVSPIRRRLLTAGHGHFVALGGGDPLVDTTGAYLTDASGAVLYQETTPLVFRAGRSVSLDAGTFSLAGQEAILVRQSLGVYAFAADGMQIALAGQDVEPLRSLVLAAEEGVFSTVGFDFAGFRSVPPLDAELGTFSLAGQSIEIKRDFTLEAGIFRILGEVDFVTLRRRVYIRFGPLIQRPGRIYPGTTIQVNGTFMDAEEIAIDPLTTILRISSPSGTRNSYTFGSDGGVIRRDADGRYIADIRLTEPGRWTYAWECLTADVWSIKEGELLVQVSPFYSYPRDRYSEAS